MYHNYNKLTPIELVNHFLDIYSNESDMPYQMMFMLDDVLYDYIDMAIKTYKGYNLNFE